MKINCLLLSVDIVGIIIFLATLIVIFGGLTIRMIIIQKRDKKLYESLNVGMYIQTISGACGKIIGIKQVEDQTLILLQTGDTTHKSYLTIGLESVYSVIKDYGEILSDEINVKDNEKLDVKG